MSTSRSSPPPPPPKRRRIDHVQEEQDSNSDVEIELYTEEENAQSNKASPVCIQLPVYPHLILTEPWRQAAQARIRYRDICTTFGSQQSFQPGDLEPLRTSVLHACKKYILHRYTWEYERAAQHARDRARNVTPVELARTGVAWLVDLFALYLPVRLIQQLQQHDDSSSSSQENVRLLSADTAKTHPILGTIFKIQQCIEEEQSGKPLVLGPPLFKASEKFALTDQELSLVSLPLHAKLGPAASGYEEQHRIAEQRAFDRLQDSARQQVQGEDRSDDEDDDATSTSLFEDRQIDFLGWTSISHDVHPFLHPDACRTKWLMEERPDLTEYILGGTPNDQSNNEQEEQGEEPQSNQAEREQFRRRWTWVGPSLHQAFTQEESERLERVLESMTSTSTASGVSTPFAGRWEEAKRRMKTNRSSYQLWQHWQQLIHQRSKKQSANNTSWSEEDEQAVFDLIHDHGGRYALIGEWLDWPHRQYQAIGKYHVEHLDGGYRIVPGRWYDPTSASSSSSTSTAPQSDSSSGGIQLLKQAHRKGRLKSSWTAEEDATLLTIMHEHGGKPSWLLTRRVLPGRTILQCRERWQQITKKGVTGNPQQ